MLAERVDIHKSCKSLEFLLNILNDYCEAASAVVTLQKRLTKALRETAGLKVTGEIAGNAMNASANIFEALSDIDSKFAKVADKEYDAISAEVKKWFKTLAKQEKAHEGRIAGANAKIMHAGQVYEKKSKKNTQDASEEHARYIKLISALGPEISQETYNHALQVTERHIYTTYSVAACVSRIADAEWLRSCEGVRRFSSAVGQLGEWRALCEGRWTGPVPQDLPYIPDDEGPQQEPTDRMLTNDDRPPQLTMRNVGYRNPRESTEQTNSEGRSPAGYSPNAQEEFQASPISPAGQAQQNEPYPSSSGAQTRLSLATGPSSYDPPRALTDNNTGSVRSLSAFPSPPTHFPLPPQQSSQHQSTLQSQSSSSSASQVHFPDMARLTDSPLLGLDEEPGEKDVSSLSSSRATRDVTSSPTSAPIQEQKLLDRPSGSDTDKPIPTGSSTAETRQPLSQRPQTTLPTHVSKNPRNTESAVSSGSGSGTAGSYGKDDYAHERESGVDSVGYTSKPRTADIARSKGVERSDTGTSSGSIVATMRNRYSNGSGSTSPPPKDVPRLPLSVLDLATRYQPADEPSSPRNRGPSPPVSHQRFLPPLDTVSQARQAESSFQQPNPPGVYRSSGPSTTTPVSPSNATTAPDNDNAARRHRQRIDELAELEFKQKEHALQEREREVEARAQELERDRAHLINARGDVYTGDGSRGVASPPLRPRERRTSFQLQRPYSQADLNNPTPPPRSANTRPKPQYSYSTTHLVPPLSAHSQSQSPSNHSSNYSNSNSNSHSQPPSPSQSHPQRSQETAEHAPYCGCDKCSIAKYKARNTTPSPHDLRPPEIPINLRPPEKPKGWMRRLSLPVGNAFSMDSKKNTSNLGISSAGMFSLDGKKNASTTMLRGAGVQEDGRGRRSYEAGGISNRSMTNLGLGGRR